ncbi:hypothetical protein AB3X94_34450 [Paraburkholderia sp. BR10923]|uniref:hypothetical protein n=1 Tax=Paraburkholderia sp. BR10923 TaxID=3236992 RepID=UPI0028B26279|nr:hypothetical protein [Paraburkholderia youngii]
MPGDPEFGSDAEPELSPELAPDVSARPVPLDGAGDEPFATVVALPVEGAILAVVVPVVPVEAAIPELAVPVEGDAAVPDGLAELPVEEPPASGVPLLPPPPPHALNATVPPSAVRQPRN